MIKEKLDRIRANANDFHHSSATETLALITELDRLNRIMPHIGGTCKRFKIYGNEKIYGYCDHPTGVLSSSEGIALRCVINTKCENEVWELKD